MRFIIDNFKILPRATGDVLSYFIKTYPRSKVSHLPAESCSVPADFFGVCVAPGDAQGYDDFLLAELKELGVKHVRVDVMEPNPPTAVVDLTDRLHEEGIRVCLHIVQRPMRAALAGQVQIDKQWRGFIANLLDRVAGKIEFAEIGSTVNRRKWSGYSLPSYLNAWKIAREECKKRGIPTAGPNVTDFEPVYNAALLAAMRRMDVLPDIHTNNLFVERAVEPEAFDYKIAGRRLAPLLKFNMIKKAKLLADIAVSNGVAETMSTHVSWSLRRILRFLEDALEQQADYVARYACLAAVSGTLRRIYWGPLVGQREGLIDDGTDFFPEIPHVTFYGKANGLVNDYVVRPAFQTYKTAVSFLSGSAYEGRVDSDPDLEIHRFRRGSGVFHVVWTRNGRRAVPGECYSSEVLSKASFYSRDGMDMGGAPSMIGESPVYIVWPRPDDAAIQGRPGVVANACFARMPDRSFSVVNADGFAGVVTETINGRAVDGNVFVPDLLRSGEINVLRDARNRIWTVENPWTQERMVVKYFRPRNRARRVLNMLRDGKARRSWNNSNELLRRGINTAEPIAFLDRTDDPCSGEGFFVCENVCSEASVRDVFNAFNKGASEFAGLPKHVVYEQIASFLLNLHEKGVYFRDLSAGNILLVHSETTRIECCLIDTARARFYNKSLPLYYRLLDLTRICHPLNKANREEFLPVYMSGLGRKLSGWMRIPFVCYDRKHIFKKYVRMVFPKKRR